MTNQFLHTQDEARKAERFEYRRFWRILFLTSIFPILTVLALLEALAWSVGETYTPEKMVRVLAEHPDMIWMLYRAESEAPFKVALAAKLRPDVLVMGTSRVQMMQGYMFRPYSFYNMTRLSWPLDTYSELLRRLPADYRPKLILLDVDFYMFGDEYEEYFRKVAPVYDHPFSEHMIHLDEVAEMLYQHPALAWQRTDDKGQPARGILAILTGQGFRNDGSNQYPDDMLATAGTSPEALLHPAWNWHAYLTGGDKMSEARMADFKRFVDLAKERGIPLATIQMPMYGPVARSFESDPHYRILQDFRAHIAQGYFDKLGIPFFDYLSFPPYSEDYRYFVDGMHNGEPITAAVIVALASDPRFHALLPELDVEGLKRRLAEDRNASKHVLFDTQK
jgi:hypothetical protein